MNQRDLKSFVGAVVLSAVFASPSFASDLDRQLRIPFNNGTQSPARSSADQFVESGKQAQQSGNSAKAIEAWQQALALYHQVKDVPAQARVYDLLGMVYANIGQIDAAEDAFRRSLAIARDENDVARQIYGYNNVGTVLLKRAKVSEAQRSFANGLQLARSIDHAAGQGVSLSNLGLAAYTNGQYREAIALLEKARNFRSVSGDPIGSANTLNNLGDAYLAIRDYRSAYASHRQAMFLAQQAQNRDVQFRSLDGMILAFQGLGQERNYTEALNQRLAMATESDNAWQLLTSLKLMAQHYRTKKDFTVAEDYYQQAFSIAQTLNDPKEQEELLAQIGAIRSRKYTR